VRAVVRYWVAAAAAVAVVAGSWESRSAEPAIAVAAAAAGTQLAVVADTAAVAGIAAAVAAVEGIQSLVVAVQLHRPGSQCTAVAAVPDLHIPSAGRRMVTAGPRRRMAAVVVAGHSLVGRGERCWRRRDMSWSPSTL